MLADDIVAAACTHAPVLWGADGAYDGRSDGALRRLADTVLRAERFTASREVIASADAVLALPLSAQLSALQMCRMPFSVLFFEWSRDDGARCGALLAIEERDPLRGLCIGVDRMPDGYLRVCPFGTDFDWRALPNPPVETDAFEYKLVREEDYAEFSTTQPWLQGVSYADYKNFATRHCLRPYTATAMLGASREFKNQARQVIDRRLNIVRAAILLMNSKNLSQVEARDIPEKLQKARLKRGAPPLLPYSQINIRLSRIMRQRAGAVDPRNPTRWHLVRGHFKMRKTGLFWWSPFGRGRISQGVITEQTRRLAA